MIDRAFAKVLPVGRLFDGINEYILLWPEPLEPLDWMNEYQQKWKVVLAKNLDEFEYKDHEHFGFERELILDTCETRILLGWNAGPIFVSIPRTNEAIED